MSMIVSEVEKAYPRMHMKWHLITNEVHYMHLKWHPIPNVVHYFLTRGP